MIASESLDAYANELFGGEDRERIDMREEAERQGVPMIQAPEDLARLLEVLLLAARAKSVLEIGTLFGASAIAMARMLPADGKVTTLEVLAKHAEIARENIQRASLNDKVNVIEGPALESLERLHGQTFDFIFIDADKDSYPQYLDWALRLSHPGTVIVADNVWRQGSVTHPDDEASRGIAEFNRRLAAQGSLASTIVSTRDGRDAASVSVVR